MAYVAKLKKGAHELDLASGRYSLSPNFVPPTTSEATNIATGTSANRYAGGRAVGRKALPRGWSFNIQVTASSNAEAEKAINEVEYMLQQAGDESEPLYFIWRPHDHYSFEPLWGTHDAYRRIEILSADSRSKWDIYGLSSLRSQRIDLTIGLTINPYATTKRQRVGSATGGIFEDFIGQPTGRSRGIMVAPGTTNKMTNPIFGHATWNNGWTADATVTAAENKDKKFILFGSSSAKLTRNGAGSSRFTQSIDVASTSTHVLSCYAKKPDGSAVTATDIVLWYGADVTPTFVSMGDGWYHLFAQVTGVAAATATGVDIKRDVETLYVDMFQIELRNQPSPPCHGDLLGCTWSGTAHASTSTRTAARWRVAATDGIDAAQGTIRIVWRASYNSSTLGSDRFLFQDGARGLKWIDASEKWQFGDGTNAVQSAATSFSAGGMIVFHCVFARGRLELYINGAVDGSGTTYTPTAPGSYAYIGTDTSSANHIDGTFMDLCTFDRAMSAAEVSDDYDNVSQIASDDQQVAPIPWLWTDDGDDIVDNVYDSDQENFAVAGGVPGDVQSETLWHLTLSAGLSTVKTLGMSIFDTAINVLPKKATGSVKSGWWDYIYEDFQGTVPGTPANFSGGEYGANAWASQVGSNPNSPFTNALVDPAALREILGREWCLIAKISEADNDLRLAVEFRDSTLGKITGDHRTITTATTFYLVHSGFLMLGELRSDPVMDTFTYSADWLPYPDVLSGTSNSDVDFAMVVPKPLVIFGDKDETVQTGTKIIYQSGDERARVATGASALSGYTPISGDKEDFALRPNRLNYIINMVSLEGQVNPIATRTTTFSAVYVKPRWAIA